MQAFSGQTLTKEKMELDMHGPHPAISAYWILIQNPQPFSFDTTTVTLK